MKKVHISVIIPVHNTPGNVLDEHLKSVVNQRFKDYEVIVVDDNSSDENTKKVLKFYEEEYGNMVKLISLSVSVGAAMARNIGFSYAVGDYCIFIDSDDLISRELLSKSYSKIIETDADVCLFGCQHFITINNNHKIEKDIFINCKIDDMYSSEEMLLQFPASGWNRLCRRAYLLKYGIQFQSLKSDNDTFFSISTILNTKKIAIIREPSLYLYRTGTDYQISKNINPLNLLEAINKLVFSVCNNCEYTDAYKKVYVYAMMASIYEMRQCKDDTLIEIFYKNFKEKIIDGIDFKFQNERYNSVVNMWKRMDYESKWFKLKDAYYLQLSKNDRLYEIINQAEKSIYLWGTGKRGKAFEKWCVLNKIHIDGAFDKKEKRYGKFNEYGFKMCTYEELINSRGLLVVSNSIIYKQVLNENRDVINLEDYSPL